jgi:superfamily II DNA or RNA helicase
MTITLSKWDKAPYVFVNGSLPERVRNALDSEMSYPVEDAERTKAYKEGRWDGKERLLRESQNGNVYFPLGLLSRAVNILESFGLDYSVEGITRPGRGDKDVSWATEMELRDYQQDALDEALRRGNGLIAMPTGAGKTLIGIRLLYEIQRSGLVLVHRQEIAEQWADEMEEILGVDVARCWGGDRESGDFQVALYQSVFEDGDVRDDVRLDQDVLLADEAHRVGADTFSRVALSTGAKYRYGFSATPERTDNATLKVIGGVGELISNISPEALIEDGYLAEPEWELIESPRQDGYYDNWHAEYKGEIVTNTRRNEVIANKVAELPKPCYVHVERIEHGEILENMIPEARFASSETSDREEVIESFRDGELDVLVSTLLGEGFDLPQLHSLVMAGGMKTEVGAIQKVGRALRPGTDTAKIVDFIDNGRWVSDHSEERIRVYREYYGEYGP